jgi:hypothetical protein
MQRKGNFPNITQNNLNYGNNMYEIQHQVMIPKKKFSHGSALCSKGSNGMNMGFGFNQPNLQQFPIGPQFINSNSNNFNINFNNQYTPQQKFNMINKGGFQGQQGFQPVQPKQKHVSCGVKQSHLNILLNNEELEEDNFLVFLDKMNDNLTSFIKTQKGSRYMQKFLNKITPEEINLLLSKIQTFFKDIMTDSYGNYFIKRLIQSCSGVQRKFILENVK